MKPSATPQSESDGQSAVDLGDVSYANGQYTAALAHYNKQMLYGTERERSQAAIKAARCYVALGNGAKADELLQQVASSGPGPERRAAKRILRSRR